LLEYGITIARGLSALNRALPELLEYGEQRLSPLLKQLIAAQWRMLKLHRRQIEALDRRIAGIAKDDASCRALLKIEGIGPITATAFVAVTGKGQQFKNGRHLSAYLGLVPGHSNTGNKTVMLPITKRGNRYLRTLLIHGARSALYAARNKDNSRSLWLQRLQSRRGNNIAAVALANKNARVAWAVLRFGQTYRPDMAHGRESSAPSPQRLQRQSQGRLTLKPHGRAGASSKSAFSRPAPER
jgi:transposase